MAKDEKHSRGIYNWLEDERSIKNFQKLGTDKFFETELLKLESKSQAERTSREIND